MECYEKVKWFLPEAQKFLNFVKNKEMEEMWEYFRNWILSVFVVSKYDWDEFIHLNWQYDEKSNDWKFEILEKKSIK